MYNILIWRMRISQNLNLFFFFAGPFQFFFFFLPFPFLSLCLFIPLSPTTHILSVACKKLDVNNG